MRGEDRKEDVSDSTCEIERGRWTEGRRTRVQRSFASIALEQNNIDWPERHIETETQTIKFHPQTTYTQKAEGLDVASMQK